MYTCILERWGSSVRVRRVGPVRTQASRDGELDKEAEMDTERKTSEISISLK